MPARTPYEVANPLHYHEWHLWETVKRAPGKILIPDLLGHATNYVEHPELVAESRVNYASLVGRENVIAGAKCGFSSRAVAIRFEVGRPAAMWAEITAQMLGDAISVTNYR